MKEHLFTQRLRGPNNICLGRGIPELLILLCLALLPGHALAGRYIVDSRTTSVDWKAALWENHPGPPACRPCTPETAMKNARAGDVVYFRGGVGGTYDVTPREWTQPALSPSNSGTEGNPIVFRNYPGEIPHLRNRMTYAQSNPGGGKNGKYEEPLIGVNGKNWIVWDGFRLSAPDASGKASFFSARHCTIQNCEIIGVLIPEERCPANYDGIRIQECTHMTIRNCYIHGIESSQNPRGAGIKSYRCKYTVVENCTFQKNSYAIHDKQAGYHNTYTRNLVFHDAQIPGSGILVLGKTGEVPPAEAILISRNILLMNRAASAIECANPSSDITVDGNVILGVPGAWGLNMGPLTNARVSHNIVLYTDTGKGMAMRWVGPRAAPAHSDHNCFWMGERFKVRDYEPDAATYMGLGSWQGSMEGGGTGPDLHSVSEDPLFVDPGNGDFHLRPGSPCKGAGEGGRDLGAYPKGEDGSVVGFKSPPRGN